MSVAYILLGSNLGDRKENLRVARESIKRKVGTIENSSSIYETEPWGAGSKDLFVNQIIIIETNLSAQSLLENLLTIEDEMGRIRDADNKNASRIIDLDILFYNDEVMFSDRLTIPHPRMHVRKFTLVPLVELAPNFMHPLIGKTALKLLMECPDDLNVNII